MAVDIIPSVLATTALELRRRLTAARKLSPVIHLDLMDGKFVPTRSASLERQLPSLRRSRLDLHLMVKSFDPFWETITRLRPRRVYVHLEIGRTLSTVVRRLRSMDIEPGIAVNPDTPLRRLTSRPAGIRHILLMGVRPGRYHATYLHSTPRRIADVRRRWPRLVVACDGGMSPRTIPPALRAGAKEIVVGSDLAFHPHPRIEWQRLRQLTS